MERDEVYEIQRGDEKGGAREEELEGKIKRIERERRRKKRKVNHFQSAYRGHHGNNTFRDK